MLPLSIFDFAAVHESAVGPKLTYRARRSMSGMEKSRHHADIAAGLLMMLWTAPTLRHRSAIGWLRRNTPNFSVEIDPRATLSAP